MSATMKEVIYNCPECSKSFEGYNKVRRHYKIVHHCVKNFECRFCQKRFAKAQSLKHHEMAHMGQRPHACTKCDMRFVHTEALRKHMKIHDKLPNLVLSTILQAQEELVKQERETQEAKRKAEIEREAAAEIARRQLELISKQEEDLKRRQKEAFENLPKAIPKERLPPGSDITIATNLLPTDLEALVTKN